MLSEAHAFPSFFFKYSKPAQYCQNKQIMMECDEENLTYSFHIPQLIETHRYTLLDDKSEVLWSDINPMYGTMDLNNKKNSKAGKTSSIYIQCLNNFMFETFLYHI